MFAILDESAFSDVTNMRPHIQVRQFPSGHMREPERVNYNTDFPSKGMVCLLDDIEKQIITWEKLDDDTPHWISVTRFAKGKQYPESHHEH